MKPLKLEIEGVNSFQEKQTIDFVQLASNNLFCISGVTGSGKTTILDSLILALYEKLPANSSRGKVEDYINLRCDKAVIKLTFELEGKIYRSERVISRKAGANTAKLVDVDSGVTIKEKHDETFTFLGEKLGLDVEQFTRVIVLQQGEFSRFLKAGKADRNKMIINLFKLSRFDSVPKKFADAEKLLDGQIKQLDKSLEQYENVSAEALETLKKKKKSADEERVKFDKTAKEMNAFAMEAEINEKKRIDYDKALSAKEKTDKELEILVKRKSYLEDDEKTLRNYAENVEKRRGEREELIAQRAKLESEKKQLADIESREKELELRRGEYKKAAENAKNRQDMAAAAAKEIEELKITAGEFADKTYGEVAARLSELNVRYVEYKKNAVLLDESEKRIKELETAIEKTKELVSADTQAVISAEKEKNDCLSAVERAKIEMGADAIKRGLKRGDVCPVCGEIVKNEPVISHGYICENAEKELKNAEEKLKNAENRLKTREVELAGLASALSAEKLNEKNCKAGLLSFEQAKIIDELGELGNAEKTLKKLDAKKTEFIELNAEAGKAKALAEQKLEQGKQNRRDLDERKKNIESKTQTEIDARSAKIVETLSSIDIEFEAYDKLKKEVENNRTEILKQEGEIKASLAALEKVLSDKPKKFEKTAQEYAFLAKNAEEEKDRLLSESAELKTSADRMSEDLERKRALKTERAELKKKYDRIFDISKALKGEFTAFVAAEYIKDFTYNASATLRELTGGKYSLTYEEHEGEFYVTDFLNNNEQRKIKTLSGGETFLASLSMAIALSQEIARYGNFDFFFIDEGFGTLHEQALEQALEVLSRLSRSSLVGIVTHRTELLGRVPMTLLVTQASEGEGSVCRIL